ncbi:MAG: conjugal transfer protein TraE, partial [Clostridia bacterium]|nr:conjugal transfer protein TraE [Clostridia bacterium]
MSRKQRTAVKLTRTERKQIEAIMHRRHDERKKPYSAQQTIDFKEMWPDGVCQVTDTFFSKTIQFQDINYKLAHNEDKDMIFNGWCSVLNAFDPTVSYQFSFLNLTTNEEEFEESVTIPLQGDDFDEIREEYSRMLQGQLAKGNNALTKTKYITFGINAGGIKTARPRLEQIELGLLSELRRMGVAAESLNGKERLRIMHSMFHMDTHERFSFDWSWLLPSGLNTKDFIAPSSFDFRKAHTFRMGQKHCSVSMMQILAPSLEDDVLTDFLSIESDMVTTMHIRSIDQVEALKRLRRMITDLDRAKIEEQKKAVRSGYDMDILPRGLVSYGPDV